jgi:hypothetical protein
MDEKADFWGVQTAGVFIIEIGHEKAQSVIDSITNSYAAEGQASANPMLSQPPGPGHPMPPPPFGFPGGMLFHWAAFLSSDETRHLSLRIQKAIWLFRHGTCGA